MQLVDIRFLENDLDNQKHRITSVNATAAIVFALQNVQISWIVDNYDNIFPLKGWSVWLMYIYMALALGTFLALLKLIFPRLGTDSPTYYFGGIASLKFDEFKKRIERMEPQDIQDVYVEQIYEMALVARSKYRCLQYALTSWSVGMIIGFIMIMANR